MHATDAKTQKIEPDPNFFMTDKISEAVCKRDWHNVRSYLFFYLINFGGLCFSTTKWKLELTSQVADNCF